MKFLQTPIPGTFVIDLEPREDDRGFFARTWCQREFEEHDLDSNLSQCSISVNKKRGTLRGMHYQAAPHEEAKLVRCTKGAIYDVVLDLRSDSPTFKQWISEELTAQNHRALFIPKGCAHGFQTLEDDTEVLYLISVFYVPDSARGVRCDDPAFAITWPIEEKILSEKDQQLPDFVS